MQSMRQSRVSATFNAEKKRPRESTLRQSMSAQQIKPVINHSSESYNIITGRQFGP